jgi:NAD-dependent deacetylase
MSSSASAAPLGPRAQARAVRPGAVPLRRHRPRSYARGVLDSPQARLAALCERARAASGPIVFLTGAGISAESGIPTFRGPEGYWTVGSTHYRPEQLATRAAFARMPEEIWAWYLYRRAVCRAARPNAAHRALVDAETALGERFVLVTQNVDGLHLRAGSTPERTHQIHGNIDFLRCEAEHPRIRPLPEALPLDWPKTRRLSDVEISALRCCGAEGWSRPHVLWFDESYDEPLFRFESSLGAARRAAMVVVVGTSGATTLPSLIVDVAAQRGIPLICVNQDESPFTELARELPEGLVLTGTATEHVPAIVRCLTS